MSEGAEEISASELLEALNRVHHAASANKQLTRRERAEVFGTALLFEQENTVGPKVREEVAKFDCPVLKHIVLRPLVNQEYIILFMATIGLNFFLEGFGEMLWGANVKRLDVGIPDTSFKVAGVLINRLERGEALGPRTLDAIQGALEKAGCLFVDDKRGVGVLLKRSHARKPKEHRA